MLILLLFVISSCRPRGDYSTFRGTTPESAQSLYIPVALSELKKEDAFQIRGHGNSEQCFVPSVQVNVQGGKQNVSQTFGMMQCDGKAHWELVSLSTEDANEAIIKSTVLNSCLGTKGGNLTLEGSFSEDPNFGSDSDCADTKKFYVRLGEQKFGDPASNKDVNSGAKGPFQLYKPIDGTNTGAGNCPMGTSYNNNLNYGRPFVHPGLAALPGAYISDGWSAFQKRWLSKVHVFSDSKRRYVRGLVTEFISDSGVGEAPHELGKCKIGQNDKECVLIGTFDVGSVSPSDDIEVLKTKNFIKTVTVLYDEKWILGLKIEGNLSSSTISVSENPNAKSAVLYDRFYGDEAAELDICLKLKDKRVPVVSGFHASFGGKSGEPAGANGDTVLKGLGVISSDFDHYASFWKDGKVVSSDGQTKVSTRELLPAVDYKGNIVSPKRTDPGYFENVGSTSWKQGFEYWISDIHLYSGGGDLKDDAKACPSDPEADGGFGFGPSCVDLVWKLSNDVIGMHVRSFFSRKSSNDAANDEGSKPAEVIRKENPCNNQELLQLSVGVQDQKDSQLYIDLQTNTEDQKTPDCMNYIGMVEYKPLQLPKTQDSYEFHESPGFGAIRFTISSMRINTESRKIGWDVSDLDSVARTATTKKKKKVALRRNLDIDKIDWPMKGEDKWRKFDVKPGYAVTGFYGIAKEVKNVFGQKFQAIQSLGLIVAPIACALGYQRFSKSDIQQIDQTRVPFNLKKPLQDFDNEITCIESTKFENTIDINR